MAWACATARAATTKIVVRASQDYGPESTPLSNLGVALTTSGHMTWTLTLNRR
jgi:hypothetical protein